MPQQWDPWRVRVESPTERAVRRAKTFTIGFACGGTVGTAAYFLRMQRLGKQGAASGAFLGLCLGVGSLIRNW